MTGRVIVKKPCCLSKGESDHQCLGVIDWRKETLVLYRFRLVCVNKDPKVNQSIEAMEGICCESVRHKLENHRPDGWRSSLDVTLAYNESFGSKGHDAFVNKLIRKFRTAHNNAYSDAVYAIDRRKRLKRWF